MAEDKKIEELESKKLDDTQARDAAGGWMLDGKQYENTPEFYAKYGITYERYFWTKDKYSIYGVNITQEDAERIIHKIWQVGHLLSKEELHDLGITGF